MIAAAIELARQKLFTAAKILDQKLYTSYSYLEGLSNPSGYRGLSSVNWIEGYRV